MPATCEFVGIVFEGKISVNQCIRSRLLQIASLERSMLQVCIEKLGPDDHEPSLATVIAGTIIILHAIRVEAQVTSPHVSLPRRRGAINRTRQGEVEDSCREIQEMQHGTGRRGVDAIR